MYQNKSINSKRKWIPIAWYCTKCGYIYKIVSDTLIYKVGNKEYIDNKNFNCKNCSLRLSSIYRHINPKDGKQKWLSIGKYCTRCKYIWINKKL